jgi:enoyl-CoA hydratase
MRTQVELIFESDSRVARVQFQGKKGIQLLSTQTRQQLAEVVGKLEQAADCRIVVFEAQGRTFIAGADIQELSQLTAETAQSMAREAQQLVRKIENLKAVTISAIHAACAGGGTELSLACDMRMAAESARIGLPEVSLGVIPGWGGTVRATRLFGGAVARRMILTGELFESQEALRLGIVDSVSSDETFRDAVNACIDQVLSKGPQACLTAKRLISDFEGPDIEAQLRAEAQAFAACYTTGETKEGIGAFLEKRQPNWEL